MACAVTALPILILLMEKLEILRQPIGQRILRYASLDDNDIAIWGVLAIILLDWNRVGRQVGFIGAFAMSAFIFRKIMHWLEERDRWYVGLIWLAAGSFAAAWSGMHFMVGAVMEAHWFNRKKNGPDAPSRATCHQAGLLSQHRIANQLGRGWGDSISRPVCVAGSIGRWKIGRCPYCGEGT